jgi:hypothetical protein
VVDVLHLDFRKWNRLTISYIFNSVDQFLQSVSLNSQLLSELFIFMNPNVAKTGAIQSQGAKGASVVVYCKSLATPDLDGSGFPARGTT